MPPPEEEEEDRPKKVNVDWLKVSPDNPTVDLILGSRLLIYSLECYQALWFVKDGQLKTMWRQQIVFQEFAAEKAADNDNDAKEENDEKPEEGGEAETEEVPANEGGDDLAEGSGEGGGGEEVVNVDEEKKEEVETEVGPSEEEPATGEVGEGGEDYQPVEKGEAVETETGEGETEEAKESWVVFLQNRDQFHLLAQIYFHTKKTRIDWWGMLKKEALKSGRLG